MDQNETKPIENEITKSNSTNIHNNPNPVLANIGASDDQPKSTQRIMKLYIPPAKRLDWIDGLRGLAELIIIIHHIGDNTFANKRPDILRWGTPQSWVRNGQFAVAIFFVLSARVITYSFLKSRLSPKGLKWASLTSTIFRRTFRLAIPVFATVLVQWLACRLNWFDQQSFARNYLGAIYLYPPQWCRIVSISDTWNFLLDIFTSGQSRRLLTLGSSLWSMYAQFWGSIYIYALTIVTSGLNTSRYLIYIVLFVVLFLTSSFNLVFLIGFVFADLDASGYTSKIKKLSSKILLPLQVLLAVAFFAIITRLETAVDINSNVAEWTTREGTLNYDPSLWPTLVTFGIYLLQMTLIYTLMPVIVRWLVLNNPSLDYSSVILWTFAIMMVVLVFVGWVWFKTVDEIALHSSHYIWMLVSKADKSASAVGLLVQTATAAWEMLLNVPQDSLLKVGRIRALFAAFPSRVESFIVGWWSWRNVCSNPSPESNNPGKHEQGLGLNSDTDRDKKFSTIFRPGIKRGMMEYYHYLSPIHGVVLSALWVFCFTESPVGYTALAFRFNVIWQSLWLLLVPYALLATLGFLTPRIIPQKTATPTRNKFGTLWIVVCTNGVNNKCVQETVIALGEVSALHEAVKVVLVQDYENPVVTSVTKAQSYYTVPQDFDPGCNHKARALEYFKTKAHVQNADFVLVLDEETELDQAGLAGVFEFIRFGKWDMGEGVVTFTGRGYIRPQFYKSLLDPMRLLISICDAGRVGDQLSRRNVQTSLVHRAVFGAQGSFVAISGRCFNAVGFAKNTSLTPLYEFADTAWKMGFTSGPIHAVAREQSPLNLDDFLVQRQRWYTGLQQVAQNGGVHGITLRVIRNWANMVLVATSILLAPAFAFYYDSGPAVAWVAVPFAFSVGTLIWVYVFGSLFQDMQRKIAAHIVCCNLIVTVLLLPFAWILEVYAVINAMKSPAAVFKVIKKL